MEVTSESNWHKLQFPRGIGPKEAKAILRHLVVNLNGDCHVDLNVDSHYTLGDRFKRIQPRTLEEVPMYARTFHMSGVISRTDGGLWSVEYNFSPGFNRRTDRTIYSGVEFAAGAFDWDDLDIGTRELVADVRDKISGYFER